MANANKRPSRASFGGAGAGANLAAFAGTPVPAAPAQATEDDRQESTPGGQFPAAPAPVSVSSVIGDDTVIGDNFDLGEVEDEPARPRKPRKTSPQIVRKNFPMEKDFIEELIKSRQKWHMDDVSRMDHFNGGMASENAYLQAVARLGMLVLERNQKDADRLLKLFPTNTRTR